jgi:hypothetical protein
VPLRRGLARRFRQGRLFLAGDAAHNYSPATGQGMNAGIQNAVTSAGNWAWRQAMPRAGPLTTCCWTPTTRSADRLPTTGSSLRIWRSARRRRPGGSPLGCAEWPPRAQPRPYPPFWTGAGWSPMPCASSPSCG